MIYHISSCQREPQAGSTRLGPSSLTLLGAWALHRKPLLKSALPSCAWRKKARPAVLCEGASMSPDGSADLTLSFVRMFLILIFLMFFDVFLCLRT